MCHSWNVTMTIIVVLIVWNLIIVVIATIVVIVAIVVIVVKMMKMTKDGDGELPIQLKLLRLKLFRTKSSNKYYSFVDTRLSNTFWLFMDKSLQKNFYLLLFKLQMYLNSKLEGALQWVSNKICNDCFFFSVFLDQDPSRQVHSNWDRELQGKHLYK